MQKEGLKTGANKKEVSKKNCLACPPDNNLHPIGDFYMSESPLYSDGRVPWCKSCIKNSVLDEDGQINEEKLMDTLRQIDKPFYRDTLQSAINQFKKENGYIPDDEIKYHGDKIFGLYITKVQSLRQLRSKSYSDSQKDGFVQKNSTVFKKTANPTPSFKKAEKKKIDDEVIDFEDEDFEVTRDMVDLFGEGYTRLEYKKMVKKYQEMSQTYIIQTSIHKEALVTYVRFKVKEEIATSKGDVTEAQKWYAAAQDAAEKGKLTAKQISSEDLQSGIVNFSDIFKTVEGMKERISIFPEFKYQPKDAVDFIIWCYINYERNLNNMPEASYYDIYRFYDEKKREYIEMYGDPYGIFENDTTESNREIIEKFITIPPEFKDGDG